MKKSLALILSAAFICVSLFLIYVHPFDLKITRIITCILMYLPLLIVLFTSAKENLKIKAKIITYVFSLFLAVCILIFDYYAMFTEKIASFNLYKDKDSWVVIMYVLICMHALSAITVSVIFGIQNKGKYATIIATIFAPFVLAYIIVITVMEIIENIQDEELKSELYMDIIFLVCALPLGLIMTWITLRKIRLQKHPELDNDYANYVTYEGENGEIIEIDTITGDGSDGHHYEIDSDGEATRDD